MNAPNIIDVDCFPWPDTPNLAAHQDFSYGTMYIIPRAGCVKRTTLLPWSIRCRNIVNFTTSQTTRRGRLDPSLVLAVCLSDDCLRAARARTQERVRQPCWFGMRYGVYLRPVVSVSFFDVLCLIIRCCRRDSLLAISSGKGHPCFAASSHLRRTRPSASPQLLCMALFLPEVNEVCCTALRPMARKHCIAETSQ
jgi:hypothetical protein